MDFPKITVHAGKCYKALIDSRSATSLIRLTTCQLIDDSFTTSIQLTTTKLNMADGFPMMALGMTTLHLRIVDFKFIQNFIICNRLLDTDIIFSLSYAWNKEKNCYIQRDHGFLTYTRNSEQKTTLGMSNQLLKYLLDIMASYQSRQQATQSKDI